MGPNQSCALCFADVGVPYEAKEHTDSHLSSYCDSTRTVTDVAADMLDNFCSVNAPHESLSSHLTAEEIIKHASETVALKQLSRSLSGSGVKAVTEMPCRDDEVDGAEDTQEHSCERTEPVNSTDTKCDSQLQAAECTAAVESSYSVASSLTQKSLAVAALPSGVYITKTSLSNDSQAIATSQDSDTQNPGHDRRRVRMQKQFPILHDLSQRPQPS